MTDQESSGQKSSGQKSSNRKPGGKVPGAARAARDARSAAALRENLKRRKDQLRARRAGEAATQSPGSGDKDPPAS